MPWDNGLESWHLFYPAFFTNIPLFHIKGHTLVDSSSTNHHGKLLKRTTMGIIRKALRHTSGQAAAYKIAISSVMLLLIVSGVGGFFAAVATGNQGNAFTKAQKTNQYQYQYQYATTRSTAFASTSSSSQASTTSSNQITTTTTTFTTVTPLHQRNVSINFAPTEGDENAKSSFPRGEPVLLKIIIFNDETVNLNGDHP